MTAAAWCESFPVGVFTAPRAVGILRHRIDLASLEKTTPEGAAANIVRGIEEGQTYILPDPMALQIGQLWATDGRHLEK